MFTIRRMTMADKPALLEITSRIWEGSDYLPGVFDEWVLDPDGEFAGVFMGGALVGCGKLTFLTPADAWLEGLRKDPRVKEKGMAEAVARHFFAALANRPSLASVRFTTYVLNHASITANERLGFQKRAVLSLKAWEGSREELFSVPLVDQEQALRHVRMIEDERAVLAFLERSGYFASTSGFMVDGWRTYPYSPRLLVDRYVRRGHCRGIVSGEGLRALSISTVAYLPSRTMTKLVCLDALDQESARIMVDDVFLAARAALSRTGAARCEVEWMIPRVPRLLAWAAERGLKSWEREDDFLVYELPLDVLEAFRAQGSPAAPLAFG